MTEREGVIQFRAIHTEGSWRDSTHQEELSQLLSWRLAFLDLGLVGQDPARYEGLGFGNLSFRLSPFSSARGKRRFAITATQTGGIRDLDANGMAQVDAYDLRAGAVESRGPRLPSSEAMTHAAFYDQGSHLRWVMHAHSPNLWQLAMDRKEIHLPTTRPQAGYGSLELAHEIRRLWQSSPLPEIGVAVIGGHQDGVFACGRSADECGARLMKWVVRAQAVRLRLAQH